MNPKDYIDTQKKQAVGPLAGGAYGGHPVNECDARCAQSTAEGYQNGRHILDRLIEYHNRQSNLYHALLRGIPQEMTPEAERALYELAKTALASIR